MTWRILATAVLVIAGLGLVIWNGRKLISDWPRPKPRHNVDVAWIQVYVGLAALVLAWILIRNPARLLFEPTPQLVAAPAGASSAGQ